jgi:hypothetical protein
MKSLFRSLFRAVFSGALVFLVFSGLLAFLPSLGLSAWFEPEWIALLDEILSYEMILILSLICAAFVFFSSLIHRLRWLKLLLFIGLVAGLFSYSVSYLYTKRESIQDFLSAQGQDLQQTQTVEYSDRQLYSYEGLPDIYVVPSGALSAQRVDEIVSAAIVNQPQFMLENCSAIYLMNDEVFDQEQKDLGLENVVGLANSADMSVKILIQEFEGPYIDTSMPEYIMDPIDYYINTITHELSHIVDYQYAYNQSFYSDDASFLSLYEEHKEHLGDYAASNAHEFFAESSKLYQVYPDYLRSLCPESYVYFQSLYADK